MNDLSRHVSMDDPKLYRFERTSGLPIGYFSRKTQRRRWPSVDRFVFAGILLCALIAWAIPQ